MPQLIGGLQFIGSLDNMSAYKMRGSDKIILRKKGGPSKKQVKHSINFVNTRRNNSEFGGRAKAASNIKRILFPMLFIADYNLIGPLNALLKPIQKMDTGNEWGKRHILLTQYPQLLVGFSLNRRFLFDSIVRPPVSGIVQNGEAIIDLPALLPDINFMMPDNYGWYRFIGVAGQIPDLYYNEHGYRPQGEFIYGLSKSTDWLPVNTPAPAGKLIITGLPERKPENCSIMIAVGIAFGNMQRGHIEAVKYVGAAKVIGME